MKAYTHTVRCAIETYTETYIARRLCTIRIWLEPLGEP